MRHRKDGRQFGRNTSHRRAMFRNLAANLVNHERIVTTDAKAKEVRRVTERLITKAKRLGPVAHTPHDQLDATGRAKRLAVARNLGGFLPRWGVERDGTKRDLIEKVMVDLTRRFAERPGGYTRIIKLGARKGDGAQMSVIEFVDAPPVVPDVAEGDDAAAGEPVASEETAAAAATSEAPADDGEGGDDAASSDGDDDGPAEDETATEDASDKA